MLLEYYFINLYASESGLYYAIIFERNGGKFQWFKNLYYIFITMMTIEDHICGKSYYHREEFI